MLSAASETAIPSGAINRGGVFRYLTKPCRTEDLRAAAHEGVRLARMLRQTQNKFVPLSETLRPVR